MVTWLLKGFTLIIHLNISLSTLYLSVDWEYWKSGGYERPLSQGVGLFASASTRDQEQIQAVPQDVYWWSGEECLQGED